MSGGIAGHTSHMPTRAVGRPPMADGAGVDICPACGVSGAGVVDSRLVAEGRRRRKRCWGCDHRWSTIEMHEERAASIEAAVRVLAVLEAALRTALPGREIAALVPRRDRGAAAVSADAAGPSAAFLGPGTGMPENGGSGP